jgi:hypothetical protein
MKSVARALRQAIDAHVQLNTFSVRSKSNRAMNGMTGRRQ